MRHDIKCRFPIVNPYAEITKVAECSMFPFLNSSRKLFVGGLSWETTDSE